jgi:hypothetical protein
MEIERPSPLRRVILCLMLVLIGLALHALLVADAPKFKVSIFLVSVLAWAEAPVYLEAWPLAENAARLLLPLCVALVFAIPFWKAMAFSLTVYAVFDLPFLVLAYLAERSDQQ